MMPRRTTVRRGRGQWVADVPGYGVLPVVHSDLSDFGAKSYRAEFDLAQEPIKLTAHLKAFADNPGYVLVQRDLPREAASDAYQADGYVGVYAINGFTYDEEQGHLEFTYTGREPVRLG